MTSVQKSSQMGSSQLLKRHVQRTEAVLTHKQAQGMGACPVPRLGVCPLCGMPGGSRKVWALILFPGVDISDTNLSISVWQNSVEMTARGCFQQ